MPVTTRITTFFGSRIPQPLNRFQVLSFHRACLMNFCPYSGRDEDTTYSQLAVGCTWDGWYVLRHSQPKWHCWFVFKKTFCDHVDLVPESELKHSAKELCQCWVLSIFLMIADMKPSSSYIHTHPPLFWYRFIPALFFLKVQTESKQIAEGSKTWMRRCRGDCVGLDHRSVFDSCLGRFPIGPIVSKMDRFF